MANYPAKLVTIDCARCGLPFAYWFTGGSRKRYDPICALAAAAEVRKAADGRKRPRYKRRPPTPPSTAPATYNVAAYMVARGLRSPHQLDPDAVRFMLESEVLQFLFRHLIEADVPDRDPGMLDPDRGGAYRAGLLSTGRT